MENKVEEIMKNYKKEMKKIDNKYEVKEVKKPDFKEVDEKIEYEKSFIEKLEFEGKEVNAELIDRAKARLEVALKEKEEKEAAYEKNVNKREEKLSNIANLKNSKVILPSGREVTQTEKDEMDKNDLKNKAIRELTQENKRISEELVNKKVALEDKRKEWNDFKYEFEKDENGNLKEEPINRDVVEKIHQEFDDIKKEIEELNKMQEDCNKYLEELKSIDKAKMEKFSQVWNEYNKKENEEQAQGQPVQGQPVQGQPIPKQPVQMELNKKLESIYILEGQGIAKWEYENGEKGEMSLKEIKEEKKEMYERLEINELSKMVSDNIFDRIRLYRKMNPAVIMAIGNNQEQLYNYMGNLLYKLDKKEFDFNLTHDLSALNFIQKLFKRAQVKAEEKCGATILGKLFDKNKTIAEKSEDHKEKTEESIEEPKSFKEQTRVDNEVIKNTNEVSQKHAKDAEFESAEQAVAQIVKDETERVD